MPLIIISAHQLSKSFSARPLFSGLTFAIEAGERIGLIGPNGAGKSTLLRILAAQMTPDSGTLSMQRGLRVGLLEQVPLFSNDSTVLSTILEGVSDPHDRDEIRHAHELISRFELDRFSPETLLSGLSGGWKKRVALARELVKRPDLLLLDEPTNHLDLDSILWLEGLVAQASFATVTITHDRAFLQRVANRIIELDPRHADGLLSVRGDYASYVKVREELISAQERREIVLKNTLRRETEWLRRGAAARTTKQQARITRAGDLRHEVEELETRNQERRTKIDFQAAKQNPKKLLEAKNLAKSYGNKAIFAHLDLFITPGTRIGLLGRNGSGKSTLIRVLLGHEEPSAGTVFRSEHFSVAYFDQTREALDPEITVAKTICPSGETVEYRGNRVHIRGYLERFLFDQAQMDMPVGRLSGGEQSRLLIARLMLTQANLLVLDEPTNDLDLATLGVLEECLTEFSGAVILVTHDRYFLDRVADRLLAFSATDAKLLWFADLLQWEKWNALQDELERVQKAEARTLPKPEKNAPTPSPAKKRKLSYNEQRELSLMEATIHAAEQKLSTLTTESGLPENMADAIKLTRLTTEMAAAQAEIDRLYRRWAELEGE